MDVSLGLAPHSTHSLVQTVVLSWGRFGAHTLPKPAPTSLWSPGIFGKVWRHFCLSKRSSVLGGWGGVEEVSATANYWEEETREVAQHPRMHRTAPLPTRHTLWL